MPTTIICPSGLSGEIRGLKGKEGKLLADRNAARAGSTFEKLLSGCWLQTIDHGVYAVAEGAALDWSKVLVADRFYTLLQIRSLTFGDDYAFSIQCKGAGCRCSSRGTATTGSSICRARPRWSRPSIN